MKPLGDDARSLIDDAADAYEPTLDDKKRLRSEVGARIAAVGVGVGVAATTASVTAATTTKTAVTVATTGGVGFGMKVGAVVIVATATLAGAWLARSEPSTPQVDRELANAQAQQREHPSDPLVGSVQRANGTTIEEPPAPVAVTASAPQAPAVVPRATLSVPAAARTVHEAPTATPAPAAVPPAESETSYIKRAETAIDTGDGIASLQTLDDHRKFYPEGILAGRREVLRVIATCTVGRVPAAREQGEKYLAEHPRTMEAARIRRVCGVP